MDVTSFLHLGILVVKYIPSLISYYQTIKQLSYDALFSKTYIYMYEYLYIICILNCISYKTIQQGILYTLHMYIMNICVCIKIQIHTHACHTHMLRETGRLTDSGIRYICTLTRSNFRCWEFGNFLCPFLSFQYFYIFFFQIDNVTL